MSRLVASVSGVRGVFADSLDPAVALRYAANFGRFIGKHTLNPQSAGRPKIVVGRDSRTTGPTVQNAVVSGLLGVGCDVVEIGVVPTPTVLLNVQKHHAQGGMAITASHNPPQWNALKFADGDGMFLESAKSARFLAQSQEEVIWQNWKEVGKLTKDSDAVLFHINKILQIPWLDTNAIRSRKFKVVIDSVNGAGGLASPLLLKELGCDVIEINSEPTGFFAHPAEPLNKNLKQLEEAVKLHHADLGFATDPDVDRLSIVDEKGKCIGEEYSVALAELFLLPKNPGDIVVNLSSSMLSDHIAARFGVKVHRTKVGEINVGKLMQEIKSPVGGEGNGGIICPDVNYTRDAMAGMALILGLLAESGKTVSQIVQDLPRFHISKAKMEIPATSMDAVLSKMPELLPGYEFDTLDGIKAIAEDHWIHIRKSGTEPIIRIYAESPSQEFSDKLCSDTIATLQKFSPNLN
ncbi:MAG: phosphoglucosamine mutase [Candidatus Syntrophosphaera sp.]